MTAPLDDVDLTLRIPKKEAEAKLLELQEEIVRLHLEFHETGMSANFVFEGWDASGKGGAIQRLTAFMNPAWAHIHRISKPTVEEYAHHYLWRFWNRIPRGGEMAFWDRSWYGRVLVERIENFATRREWMQAFEEINQFEKTLYQNGHVIVKIFMHCSPETQLKRFKDREKNPLKKWKMNEEDYRNRKKWPQYTRAINDMIDKTATDYAPWYVVSGNHKPTARVEVCKVIIAELEKALTRYKKLAKAQNK